MVLLPVIHRGNTIIFFEDILKIGLAGETKVITDFRK